MAESLAVERKMVIQRVRNPKDRTNFVDIAVTTEYTIQTGSGATFMRNIYKLGNLQLGDDSETGPEFTARNRADVVAAAASFAAAHPD